MARSTKNNPEQHDLSLSDELLALTKRSDDALFTSVVAAVISTTLEPDAPTYVSTISQLVLFVLRVAGVASTNPLLPSDPSVLADLTTRHAAADFMSFTGALADGGAFPPSDRYPLSTNAHPRLTDVVAGLVSSFTPAAAAADHSPVACLRRLAVAAARSPVRALRHVGSALAGGVLVGLAGLHSVAGGGAAEMGQLVSEVFQHRFRDFAPAIRASIPQPLATAATLAPEVLGEVATVRYAIYGLNDVMPAVRVASLGAIETLCANTTPAITATLTVLMKQFTPRILDLTIDKDASVVVAALNALAAAAAAAALPPATPLARPAALAAAAVGAQARAAAGRVLRVKCEAGGDAVAGLCDFLGESGLTSAPTLDMVVASFINSYVDDLSTCPLFNFGIYAGALGNDQLLLNVGLAALRVLKALSLGESNIDVLGVPWLAPNTLPLELQPPSTRRTPPTAAPASALLAKAADELYPVIATCTSDYQVMHMLALLPAPDPDPAIVTAAATFSDADPATAAAAAALLASRGAAAAAPAARAAASVYAALAAGARAPALFARARAALRLQPPEPALLVLLAAELRDRGSTGAGAGAGDLVEWVSFVGASACLAKDLDVTQVAAGAMLGALQTGGLEAGAAAVALLSVMVDLEGFEFENIPLLHELLENTADSLEDSIESLPSVRDAAAAASKAAAELKDVEAAANPTGETAPAHLPAAELRKIQAATDAAASARAALRAARAGLASALETRAEFFAGYCRLCLHPALAATLAPTLLARSCQHGFRLDVSAMIKRTADVLRDHRAFTEFEFSALVHLHTTCEAAGADSEPLVDLARTLAANYGPPSTSALRRDAAKLPRNRQRICEFIARATVSVGRGVAETKTYDVAIPRYLTRMNKNEIKIALLAAEQAVAASTHDELYGYPSGHDALSAALGLLERASNGDKTNLTLNFTVPEQPLRAARTRFDEHVIAEASIIAQEMTSPAPPMVQSQALTLASPSVGSTRPLSVDTSEVLEF